MRVGAFITPDASDVAATVRQAVAADETGLDAVALQDHPYQRSFLETWTALSFIAAVTRRVRLITAVANLPLRPPAMLAKAAASLQLLSSDRVVLGVGTGAFADAVVAMGGPRRSGGESVDALEEALDVFGGWWSGQRSLRLEGRHYPIAGAHPGPPPGSPIPVWLGAYKPRMLEITGRRADGWLPTIPYIDLDADGLRSQRAIDDAALAAGRDPADIERAIIAPLGEDPRRWGDELARLHTEYRFDTVLVPVPPGAAGPDVIGAVADAAQRARALVG